MWPFGTTEREKGEIFFKGICNGELLKLRNRIMNGPFQGPNMIGNVNEGSVCITDIHPFSTVRQVCSEHEK